MGKNEYDKTVPVDGRRMRRVVLAALLAFSMLAAGCGNAEHPAAKESVAADGGNLQQTNGQGAAGEVTLLDTADLFSGRDLEVGYDESECVRITLQGDTAQADSESVEVKGNVVTVTGGGSYLLTGNLQGRLQVSAQKADKVQLVFDGASISCAGSAALYVDCADKVFVTTAAGSENLLESTGEYAAIDEHNIDGAVYAREDITFNGEGLLRVKSEVGNGIACKDDLVIASGSYEITAGKHGLEGKDSVRIANGSLVIDAGQDGIHSGNDEDATVGYTYIAGGSLAITAGDDGIHSDTELVIAGGMVNVAQSNEGIEGSSVEIAGGDIHVRAVDDGLNAAGELRESHSILISGGNIVVNADGDGIDSNGTLYVKGGSLVVYGPSNSGNGALDYDGEASVTGGTVIALGSSGMAQNFGQNSSQCSILVNVRDMQTAGSTVELKDASGNVLLNCTAEKSYNSAVLSCGDIRVGETYTVCMGEESTQVEMTETIYGGGMGMGPGGHGMGGFGGQGGREKFGQDGMEGGQGGRGKFGQDGRKPQMPEGGQNGELPQMPEGQGSIL
ncbi:MAG: carbohydrate-binding domain-containing protein [Muribaculum sp.]|nr:carbohydrate-binding domain-containing protein [Muribaculum sp.]